MATRTPWLDKYAIEQSATLTGKPTFAATAIGIEGTGAAGGVFLAPLTDHPHLPPASATQENELAVGISQRHNLEYNQTIAEPSAVTLNMLANAYNLSLFQWLLFQEAAGESGTTVLTMSSAPYTTADCEMYATISRLMGGTAGNADTVSQYLAGCICRSMTITGETGGLIKVAAEMVGANWAVAVNDLGTVAYNTLLFSYKAPLKFQDMHFDIDGHVVHVPNFSVTINNNAVAQFYNNSTIQKFVLGRLTVEGSFGIPWGASDAEEDENKQLTDFQAGTDKLVKVWWGDSDGSADNSVVLKMNVRFTETEMADAEGEIVSNINFAGVYDGTYNSIEMYCGYLAASLDRGCSTATTTSTSTTSTA